MKYKTIFLFIVVLFLFDSQNVLAQTDKSNKPFILGVVDYCDSAKIISTYNPVVQEIERVIGKKSILKVFPYDRLKYAIMHNEIDMAVFSPNAYIDAKKEFVANGFPDIEAFASHIANGRKGYYGVIVVFDSTNYLKLSDLKGHRFMFTHTLSTSGYKLPYNVLIKHGIEPSLEFTSDELFSGSHILSIKALLEGKTDGIATYLEALIQEPSIDTADLRILHKTGLIPYNAYVFAPGTDEKTRRQVKNFMFHAHENLDVYNRIFKNILGISQWFPIDDSFYNGLRPLCGVKRSKPEIYIRYKNEHSSLYNDTIMFMLQRCREELMSTNRFDVLDLPDAHAKDSVLFKIYHAQKNMYSISVYLNNKLLFNQDQPIDRISDFPEIFLRRILEVFPIKTRLDYDGKNKYWMIHYGTNDGITEDYVLEITKGQKKIRFTSVDYQLNESFTVLHSGQEQSLSKGDPVHIFFCDESSPANQTQNKGLWDNFWSQLDNIWGVIGLLAAIITATLGAFFSYRKKKRFKYMLHQANYILKEYFEGKEIDQNLSELKMQIGELFEKHYIKEQHYQFLKEKIIEIKTIVSQRTQISDSLKTEIDRITSDGVITEKEYNRLMNLLEREERKKGKNKEL